MEDNDWILPIMPPVPGYPCTVPGPVPSYPWSVPACPESVLKEKEERRSRFAETSRTGQRAGWTGIPPNENKKKALPRTEELFILKKDGYSAAAS